MLGSSGFVTSRRGFLRGAAALGLCLVDARAGAARPRLTPQEVKARIRGPILTVPTPFTAGYAVDWQGVHNMVCLGLANGVQVYELTAGNSQYSVLSYEEIKRLTRTLVEAVGGRGVVIGATGPWWTGQAVDYARYAESVGADAVQVLLPPGSEDGYVRHFQRISAATKLALVLQGDPSFRLIERLVEIPAVVSMKEDGSLQYYVDVVKRFGRRLAIFCGGDEQRYLVGQPYGSPAFFSFFIALAPQVTTRFWSAVQKGDMAEARAMLARYEKPVFDFCLAGPRTFGAYWRGFLEHFGVAKRYVRPPEESCSEEDMRRIADLCRRLGLDSGRSLS